MTRPTDKQINNVISEIIENPGPRFPGQTYEDGIRNARDWVLGEVDEDPLSD